MTQDNHLRRSHISYSKRFILEIYLVVATITLAVVVGISLIGEPDVEIINGLNLVTDTPGLDCSAKTSTSQWRGWLGLGFIGFVRLIPVPDQIETEAKLPPDRLEARHDFVLPTYYCPIFSEGDLMEKLALPCCEIIYYTITDEV